ncbi:MAG: ATP-binding protein [Bacteroidetes bacterium]|nr:ATP-binding protein [Bacteroidota bacterium]
MNEGMRTAPSAQKIDTAAFIERTLDYKKSDTTPILNKSLQSDDLQSKIIDHCIEWGYESIALIPIKAKGEWIGLLQLNDKKVDMFDGCLIEYLEIIGKYIGIRFQNEIIHTKLKNKDALINTLLEYIPNETIIADRNGTILAANRNSENLISTLSSIEEILYTDCTNNHEINIRNELTECINTGSAKELPYLKHEDNFFSITLTPFVDGKIVISKKTIDNNNTEEVIKVNPKFDFIPNNQQITKHTERLAFTGRIAAGIAHEIRNPSTNITLALNQLKNTFEPEGKQKKYVGIVERNLHRINYLITELLNCARPPELNMQPYNIHEILENVLASVDEKIKSKQITVFKEFASTNFTIHVDKEYIERVFLNLILNSIEAIAETDGGLTISTQNKQKCFLIKIEDNGIGIPEEDIIKIFDPFFSSKQGGIGLGLTTCYGCIVSHGGTIEVTSEPSKGSIFTVLLPLTNKGERDKFS